MSKHSQDTLGGFETSAYTYLAALTAGFRVTTSLVVDQSGSTINSKGSSKGIGDSVDLDLLKALRRDKQLVLTSGKTFRLDEYRMPKSADLAVYSHENINFDHLILKAGQKAISISSESADSPARALEYCFAMGYESVHVEFGESGFKSVMNSGSLEVGFFSSLYSGGLDRFLERHDLHPHHRVIIQGLSIAVVAWQL